MNKQTAIKAGLKRFKRSIRKFGDWFKKKKKNVQLLHIDMRVKYVTRLKNRLSAETQKEIMTKAEVKRFNRARRLSYNAQQRDRGYYGVSFSCV